MYRIGSGFDVHSFAETGEDDACIVLAGVSIPHRRRLLAHSDGDVLCHALCDAMLGALALGDIGEHFPDSDERYRNISSLVLLKKVHELVLAQGWQLQNADITVIAEQPRLSGFRRAMRQSLADCLQLPVEKFSIKASTTEGLGFTGRGEGIGVQATVLLQETPGD